MFAERRKVLSLCMRAKSLQSDSATLWMVAPQASLSMGILQARTLEWVALPPSRKSPRPSDLTHISCVSYVGTQIPYHLGSPFRELFNHLGMEVTVYDQGIWKICTQNII